MQFIKHYIFVHTIRQKKNKKLSNLFIVLEVAPVSLNVPNTYPSVVNILSY